MAKLSLKRILTQFQSASATNENYQLIEEAMEDTLSRSGTSPNAMETSLDMNGYDIINIGNVIADGVPYYGDYASDPVTNPQGDPIEEGDLYYNTTTQAFMVYNGSAWVAVIPADYVTTPDLADYISKIDTSLQSIVSNLSIDGGTLVVGSQDASTEGGEVRLKNAYDNTYLKIDNSGPDAANKYLRIFSDDYTGSSVVLATVSNDGQIAVSASAPVDADHLTRKDYVDKHGLVLEHTTTALAQQIDLTSLGGLTRFRLEISVPNTASTNCYIKASLNGEGVSNTNWSGLYMNISSVSVTTTTTANTSSEIGVISSGYPAFIIAEYDLSPDGYWEVMTNSRSGPGNVPVNRQNYNVRNVVGSAVTDVTLYNIAGAFIPAGTVIRVYEV